MNMTLFPFFLPQVGLHSKKILYKAGLFCFIPFKGLGLHPRKPHWEVVPFTLHTSLHLFIVSFPVLALQLSAYMLWQFKQAFHIVGMERWDYESTLKITERRHELCIPLDSTFPFFSLSLFYPVNNSVQTNKQSTGIRMSCNRKKSSLINASFSQRLL